MRCFLTMHPGKAPLMPDVRACLTRYLDMEEPLLLLAGRHRDSNHAMYACDFSKDARITWDLVCP